MNAVKFDDTIIDPGVFPAEQGPPHRLFDLWRRTDPVHWNPPNPDYRVPRQGSALTKGFWVLTRYQDVVDVSMDQETFSSYEDGFVVWDLDPEELERQRANFMGMRPAEHAAVRRVLTPPFLPRALAALSPHIDDITRKIIDQVAPDGRCEFVFDVAEKLPVQVFCELMGIPEPLRTKVADFGNAMADVEARSSQALDPLMGLAQIAMALTADKRANPDSGLMSVMVNDQDLNLSDMAIVQFFIVFAMAGHETTRSTAAHFIHLMTRHPDQYALLTSDFDRYIDGALDEVLRYTNTTTNFRRTATREVELGGKTIAKGDKIYLSYAAANRDPSIFPDPHRFDIRREEAKKHIAFGVGPPVCLGARLAKLELRSLIKAIVTRIPDISLAGEPEWLRSIWFNAIVRMPVTFTPQPL